MINLIVDLSRWILNLEIYTQCSIFFIVLVAIRILFGHKFIERRANQLIGEIDFDNKVNAAFLELQKITKCDRIVLMQYMTEGRTLSGIPDVSLKMTHIFDSNDDEYDAFQNTCELSCGVHDIQDGIFDRLRQGVPSQFFLFIKMALVADRLIKFHNIKEMKELDIGMYKLFKDMQTTACFIAGLYGPQRRVIGFIIMQYTKELPPKLELVNDDVLLHEVDKLNSSIILLKEIGLSRR